MPPLSDVQLLVCVTCRAALSANKAADEADAPRPGAVLHQRLLAGGLPAGVVVAPVECLSNCSRGCTVALRGAGRWTYVYGALDPDRDVAAVLEGATLYHAAPDGVVPWRARSDHFRKNCIVRLPPPEASHV